MYPPVPVANSATFEEETGAAVGAYCAAAAVVKGEVVELPDGSADVTR